MKSALRIAIGKIAARLYETLGIHAVRLLTCRAPAPHAACASHAGPARGVRGGGLDTKEKPRPDFPGGAFPF
jgi:hypothetical protein